MLFKLLSEPISFPLLRYCQYSSADFKCGKSVKVRQHLNESSTAFECKFKLHHTKNY